MGSSPFMCLAYSYFASLLLIAVFIALIRAAKFPSPPHGRHHNHKGGEGGQHGNHLHPFGGSCRVYKSLNSGENIDDSSKRSSESGRQSSGESKANGKRGGGHRRVKRVASGTPGQTGTMPWLVFLSTTYQSSRDNSTRSMDCTGSLVSQRHVLTNAHCIPVASMPLSTNLIKVIYGAANKSEGRQLLLPKSAAHIHSNYSNVWSQDGTIQLWLHDLALIDLGQELDFDATVSSICLVCLQQNFLPPGDAIIAGWGNQNEFLFFSGACNGLSAVYPDVFRYASVGLHQCYTPDFVTKYYGCTFADNTHGIGGGDGGGPVLAAIGKKCHYYQVGVGGKNRCLTSQRENGFDKIDGEWLKSVSGIECMDYAGEEGNICEASLATQMPTTMPINSHNVSTTPTNTMATRTPYQCVLQTTSPAGERFQQEEAALCQMLKDEEFLSSDAMEGRRTGTQGSAMARQYLIERLRAMAIQPMGTNLDDYTQQFNYTYFNGSATIGGIIGTNVISFVPGTRLDQVIVISAHYDHLGIHDGQIYNGADDNASGSSALLYLAQHFSCPTNRPNNSLIFAHFDAEEANSNPFDSFVLRPVPFLPIGSKHFVENPPVPLANIKLNINLDMISRNVLGELYVMPSNHEIDKYINGNSNLSSSTAKLVLSHPSWERNSDHQNFADANIDYVAFTVGPHVDYHKPTDDYVNIQPEFYMDAVRAIREIVAKLDAAIYAGTL